MNIATGIALATLSGIFNGSFTALFKTPRMNSLSLHPIIFTLYVSFGVVLSSLLVFLGLLCTDPHRPLHDYWTFMGMVAGALFVSAMSASFFAIDCLGVALAQGMWGGLAMIVSYVWGVAVFGEVPQSMVGSMTALGFLVVGVGCIANCQQLGEWGIQAWETLRGRDAEENGVRSALLLPVSEENSSAVHPPRNRSRGFAWAFLVGVLGGSILAPMHYVPLEKQGLLFVPSFGLGTLLVSPILFGIHVVLCSSREEGIPPFHIKESLGAGLMSGIIYNIGNVCSILAIPIIGYKVAYPLLQCAILVSALWGIYVFQEITLPSSIFMFWIGSFIVVIGAVLLAVSK